MRRTAAVLLLLAAVGCSTAPLADLMDFFVPGRPGAADLGQPVGGVCQPKGPPPGTTNPGLLPPASTPPPPLAPPGNLPLPTPPPPPAAPAAPAPSTGPTLPVLPSASTKSTTGQP